MHAAANAARPSLFRCSHLERSGENCRHLRSGNLRREARAHRRRRAPRAPPDIDAASQRVPPFKPVGSNITTAVEGFGSQYGR
jgi:hypothetical protein